MAKISTDGNYVRQWVHCVGPGWNIWTTTLDGLPYHSPLRMTLIDFRAPLTFHLAPPADQSLQWGEVSGQLANGLAKNPCTDVYCPQRLNFTDLGDPLTFPLAPKCGSHQWFWKKCVWNNWMDCLKMSGNPCFPEGWIGITLMILSLFN